MLNFIYMYFDFIVYSFGGWIAQGFYVGFKDRKFLNTGFLYGPYVPIYGFGALAIIYIIDAYLPSNPFAIFFGTMILTSILEYFTSWAMEKMFHRLWWNYSKRPFNIHGRICLLNSTLYGIAGLFITYISQPYVNRLEHSVDLPGLEIFEILFSLVFFTDLFITLRNMLQSKKILEKIHSHIAVVASEFEKDTHLKLESAADQFAKWAGSRLDLNERISQINAHVDRLNQKTSARLSKAFPQAQLSGPIARSKAIADKLHELRNNLQN